MQSESGVPRGRCGLAQGHRKSAKDGRVQAQLSTSEELHKKIRVPTVRCSLSRDATKANAEAVGEQTTGLVPDGLS